MAGATIAQAKALNPGEVSLYSSAYRHGGVAPTFRPRRPDRTMSIRVVSPSEAEATRRAGQVVETARSASSLTALMGPRCGNGKAGRPPSSTTGMVPVTDSTETSLETVMSGD